MSTDSTFIFENIISALKSLAEWKTLGTQLEISPAKIKEIEEDLHGQVADCINSMIQFWLKIDASSSWKKLIDALVTCGEMVLAENIRTLYCSHYKEILDLPRCSSITQVQNLDHKTVVKDDALINESGEKAVNLNLLHCVYKAQNRQECSELFSKAEGKLQIKSKTLTSLDYRVIGYCMELACDAVSEIELVCQLTAEGLDIIAQTLTTMEKVRKIRIWDDLCHDNKLLALKHLFHNFPNVISLDLNHCFRNRDDEWCDWISLGELLKQTSHLQILDLSCNRIGAEGMKALCASCHFSSLKDLHLSENGISDEGMKALCAASDHYFSLVTLNLSLNRIGHEGMTAFCAASSHFSSLTTLNLSDNGVGDEGMKALCAAFIHISSLRTLKLSHTTIGVEGIKALCASSSHFSLLTSLDLSENGIGDEGIKILSAASSNFSSLTTLKLMDSLLSNDSIEYLILIIQQCPLKKLRLDNATLLRFDNRFSHQSALFLMQQAHSTSPGLNLRLPEHKMPSRSTNTARPPRSTNTDRPSRSTNTVGPPRSTRAIQPLRSTNSDRPPRSTITKGPPRPTYTKGSETLMGLLDPPTPMALPDPPTPMALPDPPTPKDLPDAPTMMSLPDPSTPMDPPTSMALPDPPTLMGLPDPPTPMDLPDPQTMMRLPDSPTLVVLTDPPTLLSLIPDPPTNEFTSTDGPPRSINTDGPPRSTTIDGPPSTSLD